MTPTARHRTVESRFRALAGANGVGPPDRVEYREQSVVFYWDEPHVAVVVDFDDLPDPTPARGRPARRPP
jgi:hypothetical protein